MNLQELLNTTYTSKNIHNEPVEVSPDFRIAVQEKCNERGVRIIVHPIGMNGETLDLWVKDNNLSAL
jgi:hypothetical protein